MVALTLRGVTCLVRCWTFTLLHGRGTLRFTEHDQPLSFGGETYQPNDGVAGEASSDEGDLRVPTAGVRGVISSSALTEQMLFEGAFNGCHVEEFLVDWRFPDLGGRTRLCRYDVGRVRWNESLELFQADLVGLSERLINRVGEIYSRTCRWQLGDANCGITLDPTWQRTGTIDAVIDAATFEVASVGGGATGDDFFNDGRLEWTVGDNDGLRGTVKRFTEADLRFELNEPPPNPLQVGDEFEAYRGCNKLSGVDIDGVDVPEGDCKHVFDNLENFGGFPYAPTNDKLYLTPSAKRAGS